MCSGFQISGLHDVHIVEINVAIKNKINMRTTSSNLSLVHASVDILNKIFINFRKYYQATIFLSVLGVLQFFVHRTLVFNLPILSCSEIGSR